MLALAVALALLGGACASRDRYTTIVTKGTGEPSRLEPPQHLFIPDGQCTGEVAGPLLRCRPGSRPTAVRVVAHDRTEPPLVRLSRSLRYAAIYRRERAEGCPGSASVYLMLSCEPRPGPAPPLRARRALSALPLPPAE